MNIFRGFDPGLVGAQAQIVAGTAERKANQVERDAMALEHKVDHLALACQALWEILSEKAGVTHEELAQKMTEIDLRDGQQDGRISPHVIQCPACGRNVSNAKPTCMFCGGPIATDSIV